MITDYVYICMDCLERFNTSPPFHEEPKHCPNCEGHDVTTVESYERNQEINDRESHREDKRLFAVKE